MADLLFPTWLNHARNSIRFIDNTAVSRGLYSGLAQSTALGGDRLSASIEFTRTGGVSLTTEQAALISFLMNMRGKQNRAYLGNAAYRQRGSFAAPELLPNPTFANGTTGYATQLSSSTLSVLDRVLRSTHSGAVSNNIVALSSPVTVTQYAPYAARAMLIAGRNSGAHTYEVYAGSAATTADIAAQAQAILSGGSELRTAVGVSLVTSAYLGFGYGTGSGAIAGDSFLVPFASLSRCALVDNGINYLLQSDVLGTTWVPTRTTVTTNSVAAPDGTTTADTLNEDGSAATSHYIAQSITVAAAAADWSYTHSVKAAGRSFVCLSISEATSGHEGRVFVNLSTGAVGTVATTGANITNVRGFSADQGNGWWAVTVVARKASAATSMAANLIIAEADNDITFSGGSTASLYAWRGTMAPSGVPTRQIQTTTTANTTGTAQTGSGIYVKGLPASTNGLLYAADMVEIITSRGSELKFLVAPLNSDAAGRGYLQISPAMRVSPADNAGVIINNPMGRFMFAGDALEYSNEPGVITTAAAEFEEA